MALGEYSLYGGEVTSSTSPSGIPFASLPAHAELAAAKAAAIGKAADMAKRAWPGIDPLRGAIVVEISPPHDVDRFGAMMAQNWFESSGTAGKLFRLLEAEIDDSEMAAPESIAANALAGELLRQRAIVHDQTAFFRYFYRAIARERLGRRRNQGATVGPDSANDEPIVSDRQWFARVYAERLPAVVADIENRVGIRQFNAAIERFISARSPRPASARELLAEIERESGVSLERMWQDFFIGRAVPQLTFEDVVFDKHGDRWRVSGTLRNKGTGEVLCPVVLQTDFEPAQSIVRVDSKDARTFTLETPYHPRTLQLDPENVCYRFATIGLVDRVEYEGGS